MPAKRNASNLYTVILEFARTTSVRQIRASSADRAFQKWAAQLSDVPNKCGLPETNALLLKSAWELGGDKLVPLDGLGGVWYQSCWVKSKGAASVHVVKTAL